MPKTLMELRSLNLEKGYGASVEDIVSCIGEDSTFDERVTQVSPKRFEGIMKAYKKKATKDYKTDIKEILSAGGKIFKDSNDYYLANHYIGQILIEVLKQGSFRVSGEKSSRTKAERGYSDLMRYLVEIDSLYVNTLASIKVDKEKELPTLVKFIDSKKEQVREAFSSYRQKEYSDYSFDRIFSQIKEEVKKGYEKFKKEEVRRIKSKEPLLPLTAKINTVTKEMNKQTKKQNELNDFIEVPYRDKIQYAHTLTQKHEYFHKK